MQYNDSDTAIVFLHGIFSDTQGCWTNRDVNVSFPALVQKDTARFGEPSIFVAGYHTTIRAGKYGVADVANEVWNGISTSIDKRPPVTSKRNIVFVCHSTGGIVARYLLLQHQDRLKDKNLGLVLIASPSAGSEVASMVAPLARLYSATLMLELRKNSPLLVDLDDRFREFVYQGNIRLSGIEMYEARRMAGILRAVTKSSASQYFGRAVSLAGHDHVSSVKPRDHKHPAYDALARFYQEDFLRKVEKSAYYAPPFATARRDLRTDSGNVVVATITPDGRDMAYAERDGLNGRRQWLKLAGLDHPNSEWTLLKPDGENDYRPYRGITFDPKGDRIYYIRSRKDAPRVHDLWRITRDGKQNRIVLEDVDTAISFNPNNPAQFAYCHGNPPKRQSEILVATLSSTGNAIVDPTPRAERKEPSTLRRVVWSPTGDSFLVIGGNYAADEMDLAIIGSDQKERPIASGRRWRSIESAVWLPTGEILFAATSTEGGPQRIWLTRPSGGDVTDVTRDLASYRSIAASADGRRLLALTDITSSRIYQATVRQTIPDRRLPHASIYYDGVDGIATSPNHDVAFTRRSGPTQDLLYFDPLKMETRELVSGDGRNESPVICAEARIALFARSLDGQTNIWKVALDGKSVPIQVTDGTWDTHPTCSADASRIVYSTFDPQTRERGLWLNERGNPRRLEPLLWNEKTGNWRPVPGFDARNSALSPDARQLATVFADPNNHFSWTIGVMNLRSGRLKRANNLKVGTNTPPIIRWESNEMITFVRNDHRTPLFWGWNVRTGERRSPFTVPDVPWVFDFDWSVRGNTIAYAGGRQESDIVTFTEAAHH